MRFLVGLAAAAWLRGAPVQVPGGLDPVIFRLKQMIGILEAAAAHDTGFGRADFCRDAREDVTALAPDQHEYAQWAAEELRRELDFFCPGGHGYTLAFNKTESMPGHIKGLSEVLEVLQSHEKNRRADARR